MKITIPKSSGFETVCPVTIDGERKEFPVGVEIEVGEKWAAAIEDMLSSQKKEQANPYVSDNVRQFVDKAIDDYDKVTKNAAQFGVCVNLNTGAKELVRMGAAANSYAKRGVGSSLVINDFDGDYPWKHIRRCNLADDGTVNAYIGDAEYKEDGSNGQVMVEYPKFYYKREYDENENKEYIWFCNKKLDGYSVPPFFTDKDGNEVDTFYLGVYEMSKDENNKALSIAGEQRNKYSYYEVNQYAQARGNNWHNIDAAEYSILCEMAFMIEFATNDSESVFDGVYESSTQYCYLATDEKYGATDTVDFLPDTDPVLLVPGSKLTINYYYFPETAQFTPPEEDVFEEEIEEGGVTYEGYKGTRIIKSVTVLEDRVRVKLDKEMYVTADEEQDWAEIVNGFGTKTGDTDIIRASSGIVFENKGTDYEGKLPFVFRGLENPFSNGYTWLNGVYSRDNKYFVSTNLSDYPAEYTARLIPENAKELKYLTPKGNGESEAAGYISKMGFDASAPWAMFPTHFGATGQSGYCDKAPAVPVGNQYDAVFKCGGDTIVEGGVHGLWYVTSNNARSSINACLGRLAYRHFE